MAANTTGAIAKVVLEIAHERRALLDRIRSALVRGDNGEALRLMRSYAGLEEGGDAAGDRVDPSLH